MLKLNSILNPNVTRFYNDSFAVINCKERYGLVTRSEANDLRSNLLKRFGKIRAGRGRRSLKSCI